MSSENEGQREFERYAVSLNVEVTWVGFDGNEFSEKSQLNNISGGGASLITEHPDSYTIGQKIELKISLPAVDALNSSMNGSGQVVWVGELERDGDGVAKASVGLCLTDLLAFEHLFGNTK